MSLPPERRQAGGVGERRKKGRERHFVDGVQGKERESQREAGKETRPLPLGRQPRQPQGVLHPGFVEHG